MITLREEAKMSNRRFAQFHLPVYLWIALIFSVSSIPDLSLPAPQLVGIDKVAHLIEYAILSFLLIRTFKTSSSSILRRRYFLVTGILGIFLGLLDEWHQLYIPGRYFEFSDLAFDLGGIILAGLINFFPPKMPARPL